MAHSPLLFVDADFERVKRAVQEAESGTSAEILPVVARSSGRYDRPEDIVGLWFAAIAVTAVWITFPLPAVEVGNWASSGPVWQLAALLVSLFAGFVAGAVLGARIDWLRRLFTSRAQMCDEVNRRAREVFFDKRVHHTDAGSGVLLFVSLFERMAVVLADQSVLDQFGQDRIDELCRELTQRLHEKTPVDALCETTLSLGQRLAPLLPCEEHDVDELSSALVVID